MSLEGMFFVFELLLRFVAVSDPEYSGLQRKQIPCSFSPFFAAVPTYIGRQALMRDCGRAGFYVIYRLTIFF
jgi:hypothetical protein